MNEKLADLDPSEFTLLGNFYTHDQFEIKTSEDAVSIVPKQYSIRGLLVGVALMTFISAPLFGFAAWVGMQRFGSPFRVFATLAPVSYTHLTLPTKA